MDASPLYITCTQKSAPNGEGIMGSELSLSDVALRFDSSGDTVFWEDEDGVCRFRSRKETCHAIATLSGTVSRELVDGIRLRHWRENGPLAVRRRREV